jgi:hypothetical protein
MFDWFKKPNYTNVVKFPDRAPVPYIEPPKQEKDSNTYYSIGHTDDNRVSIKMGYTTLTMNRKGIEDMIQQLQVFRDQLLVEDDAE